MTLSEDFKQAEDHGRRAGTKDDRDTAAPSTEDPNLSDFSFDENEDPHFQDASETVRRATKQSETDDRIKHLESAMLQITGMLETLVTAQTQARSDDANQTLKTIQTKPEETLTKPEVTTPTTQTFQTKPEETTPKTTPTTQTIQTKSEEKTPTETTQTNSVTRRIGDYKSLLRLVVPYDGSNGESLLAYIETFERYLDSAANCIDYLPKDAFNLAIGHLKGEAASEWRDAQDHHPHTWESLRQFLKSRFVTFQHVFELETAIARASQGQRSVKDYVGWFKQTKRQLSHFGKGIGEGSTAIGFFLQGLQPDIRFHVTALISTTESMMNLHQVLEIAVRLGAISPNPAKGTTALLTTPTTTPTGTRPKRPDPRNATCATCNRKGHFTAGCWTTVGKPEWAVLRDRERQKGTSSSSTPTPTASASGNNAYVASTMTPAQTSTHPVAYHTTTRPPLSTNWIMDSGASSHMTCQRSWFSSFRDIPPLPIGTSNGSSMNAIGEGTVPFTSKLPDGSERVVELRNVLYVPAISQNLFSTSCLPPAAILTMTGNQCVITRHSSGPIDLYGIREAQGLYVLQGNAQAHLALTTTTSTPSSADVPVVPSPAVVADGPVVPLPPADAPPRKSSSTFSKLASDARLWHNRLGHIAYSRLRQLLRLGALPINLDPNFEEPPICHACVQAKKTRDSFPPSTTRASRPLLILHSDVCGPLGPSMGFHIFQGTPLGDAYYFLLIIDDHSRKVWVFPIRHKSNAITKITEFLTFVKARFPDRPVKTLRTDGGGEFLSHSFTKLLQSSGIVHEITAPHSPQQNGVAERMNRTLLESARAMLFEQNLSLKYWSDAIVTAGHLHNAIPRKNSPDPMKSPDALFDDPTPHSSLPVTAFRTFGVPAFVKMPTESGGSSATREFDKTYAKFSPRANLRLFLGPLPNVKGFRFIDPVNSKIVTSRDATFCESQPTVNDPNLKEFLTLVQSTPTTTPPPTLTHQALTTVIQALTDPNTIQEARRRPDAAQWEVAINKEHKSLLNNNTWRMERLPPGRKLVGCRWVFKTKFRADGTIERYKARLVAQGYSQRYGEDYNETFAPVVKYGSVRILFALAAARRVAVHQFDINTAFLNSDLHETIYMRQPPGLERIYDDEGHELVCCLQKSIYGLKQASREWYATLTSLLEEEGYDFLESDHSVYIHRTKDSVLAVYVDDIIAIGTENVEEIKSVLESAFGIRDLGIANYMLGIEIVYGGNDDNKTTTLTQSKYAKDVLERFNMQDCKRVLTPMEHEHVDEETDEVTTEPYRELVGCLQYLVQGTRPDLAHSVGVLSRRLQNPKKSDWEKAKRVLRYIQGTIDYGVTYSSSQKEGKLTVFSDADYAGDLETRISTTGYVSILAGGPVTWASQLQKTVAKSTMEAEYMALSDAVSETIWLRRILSELKHLSLEEPTRLFCDNQSAICFAKDPIQHKRSKHIDVRYHFARQHQKDGTVSVVYVPTAEMVADPLTKAQDARRIRGTVGDWKGR